MIVPGGIQLLAGLRRIARDVAMFRRGRKRPGSSVLTAVLLGAGNRGAEVYGKIAQRYRERIRFVGVAESDARRRQSFAHAHGIAPEMAFASAAELLRRERFAHVCFNCLPDREHFDTGMAALRAGYHVLMEKPMADTPARAQRLVRAAVKHGRLLLVFHVLRYTPFFYRVRELIRAGEIGRPILFSHTEDIGYWHFAHSYVRGNWRDSRTSGPIVLTKTSHDLDLLLWFMDRSWERVSSQGGLAHFTRTNRPAGAATHCFDCPVRGDCLYDAEKYYALPYYSGWPASVVSSGRDLESRRRALRETPYGRCVYDLDNNVCDHQVVNLEFAGGALAILKLGAFSPEINRSFQYQGDRGELQGDLMRGRLTLKKFRGRIFPANRTRRFRMGFNLTHGGGDPTTFHAFLDFLEEGRMPEGLLEQTLDAHLLAFAAERARIKKRFVERSEFAKYLRI